MENVPKKMLPVILADHFESNQLQNLQYYETVILFCTLKESIKFENCVLGYNFRTIVPTQKEKIFYRM